MRTHYLIFMWVHGRSLVAEHDYMHDSKSKSSTNNKISSNKDETADYCGTVVHPMEPEESAINDKGGKHVNGEVAEPTEPYHSSVPH